MFILVKHKRVLSKLRLGPYTIPILLYLGLFLLYVFRRGDLKSTGIREVKVVESGAVAPPPPPPQPAAAARESVTAEEEEVLRRAFRGADFDGDHQLSLTEISIAISRQTKQHIIGAMRNNFKVFFALDKKKRNGQVDWEEYYTHYVRDLLHLDDQSIDTLETHPESISRYIKESISYLKAAWSEAARSNPESVNIDEFLSLEHPESSQSLLIGQVEELLIKYDEDGDGVITRKEYIADPFTDLSDDEVKERERVFDTALDEDMNGKAERREMIRFLDPKNQFWAKEEAKGLLRNGDSDSDSYLSFQEMVQLPDLFLSSKLVDAGLAFHAEF